MFWLDRSRIAKESKRVNNSGLGGTMDLLNVTRRSAVLVFSVIVGAAVVSPQSAFPQQKRTITVTGASTIAPLLQEIAHRYEGLNPDVVIDVQTGGTYRGLSDVRRKIADIGMMSRALFENERDVSPVLLARDGVAIIMHKTNPVETLSDEQIRQIYRGQLTNWTAVGGRDAAITVVNKAEGRSTLDVFLAFTKLAAKEVKAHVIVGDNEQGVKVVSANPRAIGYVSVGTAEYDIQAGVPLKMIGLGPVPPSAANVANGTYAASRPLNLVTSGSVPPHVAAFLTFATSRKNHDLLREYYFVPPAE
jgi:phosphate transport system substrate-binding protein